MVIRKTIVGFVSWLAVLTMLVPAPMVAAMNSTMHASEPDSRDNGAVHPDRSVAQKTVAVIPVRDIALQTGGSLHGQLMTPQGTPIADQAVVLFRGNSKIAMAQTDADGRFVFGELRGGVYRIAIGSIQRLVRIWSANTAPPMSRESLLIVTTTDAVRGQFNPIQYTALANPLFLAGVAAVAVGVGQAFSGNKSPGS